MACRWIVPQLCVALLLLTSCSTPLKQHSPESPAGEEEDGPPICPVDPSAVHDAVPQIEPISKYGNPAVYTVHGKQYKTLPSSDGFQAEGIASWYGKKFHGRRTSSGEVYDMYAMTAAHKHLPLPTYVLVKNMENGKEVVVKVNDRGPFVNDRLIDLSYAAATKLDLHHTGTGKVKITAIDPVAWHKDKNTHLAELVKRDPETLAETKKLAAVHDTKDPKLGNRKIYLQLGAFQEKSNADALVQKASILSQALEHLPVHIKHHHHQNKPIYKVRIGPMKNKEEAERVQKELLSLKTPSPVALIYD